MPAYSYPQVPTIVPGEIALIFEEFNTLNIPGDHILDLYLRIHSVKSMPNDIHSPYQYLKKVVGLPTGQYSIRYTDLEAMFNNNFPTLKGTAPLTFLAAHEATYGHAVNDSGLHNGMIYDRFFAQLQDNDRIAIIDPPLSFIGKLLVDEALTHVRIQLLFSNTRYAETLQKDSQLNRFFPRHFDKVRQIHASKLLIFGASHSYEQLIELFHALLNKISPNCDPVLYALIPTAYIDRRGPENLRHYIGERYSIDLAVLIPAKAANISPQKRCMLMLHRGPNRAPEVILQNTQCEGTDTVTGLTQLPHCKIKHEYLVQSPATLHSLYNQTLIALNSPKQRNRAKIYRFSAELSVGYSITQVNGKYRAKYTPYAPPTTRQLQENHEGRGSALCKSFSGKLYSTREALMADMERFCFHSTHIRNAFQALLPFPNDQPCSLKTFWYLHQQEIASDARYDGTLFEEIFLAPQSWSSELCALNVCTSDTLQIKQIIDATAQDKSMSDTRKRKFTKQIEVVFDAVRKIYPKISKNPVTPIFSELMELPDTIHAMRDNMVRRSWSHEEEIRLLSMIKTDEVSPNLALATLIRYYTGISVREACALIWEDYQLFSGFGLHTLTIRRKFKDNEITAVPLSTKDRYRAIPICDPLEAALSKAKSVLSKTHPAEDVNSLPIIAVPHDTSIPIRPDALVAYERKLLQQLNLPKLPLHVPSEEDPIVIDINDYQGDWIHANYQHHCQHDGKMDPDDIRYCLGVRPNTTAAQHYNSNLKVTSQLRMSCAINRWAAIHTLPLHASNTLHTLRPGKCSHTISSVPCVHPCEFIIDIHTPDTELDTTLDLTIFARFGMGIVIEEISKEVD